MTETFTITQLAEEFRITSRAIRFYEDKQLLHPRRQGLSRIYSRRDRGRLRLILRGKRLGFSLIEIREMLDLYDLGDGQVEQLRVTLKAAHRRMEQLQAQQRDLNEAIKELQDVVGVIEHTLAEKGMNASRVA